MEPKTITLVRSDDLSRRAPYAYAAMPPAGARLVFTAGACPLDADGETVAPGDVVTQAEQVMKNLRTALRAAGADLDNVLKTTVYVATERQEDLLAAWEVVSGTSAAMTHPARCSESARSATATNWSRSKLWQLSPDRWLRPKGDSGGSQIRSPLTSDRGAEAAAKAA